MAWATQLNERDNILTQIWNTLNKRCSHIIWNYRNDRKETSLPTSGTVAQLAEASEECLGETGSNPVEAWIFSTIFYLFIYFFWLTCEVRFLHVPDLNYIIFKS